MSSCSPGRHSGDPVIPAARATLHQLRNHLAIAVGTIELVQQITQIPAEAATRLELAVDALERVIADVNDLTGLLQDPVDRCPSAGRPPPDPD